MNKSSLSRRKFLGGLSASAILSTAKVFPAGLIAPASSRVKGFTSNLRPTALSFRDNLPSKKT